MAISAYIYINSKPIGCVTAVRKDGEPGQMCEYNIEGVIINPDGSTFELAREEGVSIKHHYDDGACSLMSSVLESFNSRKSLSELAEISEELDI